MQDDVFQGQRPEIEYPTDWGYRVVGRSEASLRTLVTEVVGNAPHEIEGVQPSSKGAYVSLRLSVTVASEEHRDAIYAKLVDADEVKIVF